MHLKGLKFNESIKGIKFEEVWSELESKKYLQWQKPTKYSSLTGLFMWNRIHGNSLISVFQKYFASINRTFTLEGRPGD